MKKECIFVDVFTDKPYTGNQLAVFPDGEELTKQQMQALAREINYSETTFLLDTENQKADFDIRIFTPKTELPFAGHPVLGTAYTIMEVLDIWPRDKHILTLKTKAGAIPVERLDKNLWMTHNAPEFLKVHKDREKIAALVGLKAGDIDDKLPIEEVGTGNNMLLVPVKNLAAIRKARGNINLMEDFFGKSDCLAPYLFTLETVNKSARVHTRLLAAHMSIIEDAATGSAAGPLTAYLLKHGVFGARFEIENEQGLEMDRPSKILMFGELTEDKYIIKVGGSCVYVGRGEFFL